MHAPELFVRLRPRRTFSGRRSRRARMSTMSGGGVDFSHLERASNPSRPDANDGDLVDLIPRWIPGERERLQLLVENPALYGFSNDT